MMEDEGSVTGRISKKSQQFPLYPIGMLTLMK